MIPDRIVEAAAAALYLHVEGGWPMHECKIAAEEIITAAFAALPECDEAKHAARDRIKQVTGFESGTPSHGAAYLGVTVAFGALATIADQDYPAPDHEWTGDHHGHNCALCPDDSPWRCDQQSHPHLPTVGSPDDEWHEMDCGVAGGFPHAAALCQPSESVADLWPDDPSASDEQGGAS